MSEDTSRMLANFISLEDKFSRSTNIELDNKNPDTVSDYRFTSKSLRLLDDVLDGVQGVRRDRAWSIIGPYGSGKSTFLLFLLQMLGKSSSPWLQRCLVQLSLANPEIERKLNTVMTKYGTKYLPVVIQGSRVPLDLSLCQGLLKTATDSNTDTSWVTDNFLSSLNITIQTIESGLTDSQSTIGLYEKAANLAKMAGYQGLVVTIDEFGKFLERARWQGDLPDLASAQYLAELASSSGDSRILFLVALHQGFQQYASSISKQQWLEWIKIQGRFSQVDFNEEPDNLYGLVATAINYQDESRDLRTVLNMWVNRVWGQVKDLIPFENEADSNFWPDLLCQVYPFHPLTLYALPRLSANLGQNERTLFTFLASNDPLGLKSFLKRTQRDSDVLPSLTADYLYDYFVNGSRVTWLPLEVQRKVSEIEAALERLGDRPLVETRLLKTIGVLSLLRTGSSLPASEKVLYAALDINSSKDKKSIIETIKSLMSRKIIVYRQFADEYRIWEGSDFDFDGALVKAREEIQSDFDLTTMLEDLIASRPIFARRHSFETGTNRLFRIRFIAAKDLLRMNNKDLFELPNQYKSDGVIIHAIPNTLQDLNDLKEWANNISNSQLLLVIPREPLGLNNLLLDLAALRKIQKDWPELEEDNVAIKELAARIESAEDYLNESLTSIIEPSSSGAIWYWRGNPLDVTNSKTLNRSLSDICDQVFSKAPKMLNELVNQQNYSSAVVIAVKKIIHGLLVSSDKPKLGFEGNGPEVSIFNSVLENNNLYKKHSDGNWRFIAPNQDQQTGIYTVWAEIEKFFELSSKSAKPFDDLYEKLDSPPYGLRKGLISLLIWIVLIYNRRTVALYENGTYLKDWDIEIFDRFIRLPSTFTVKRLLLSDIGGELLQGLNNKIPQASNLTEINGSVPINGFLINLYGWYSTLPDFTKQTNKLTMEAKKFINILLTVKDPSDFVENKIPEILGLNSLLLIVENEGKKYKSEYIHKFGSIIEEIEKTYTKLINELISFTASRFECSPNFIALRKVFLALDSEIIKHVDNTESRALLLRARQRYLRKIPWVESVTSVLCGQAPKFWEDHNIEEYKNRISLLALALNDARKSHYARTTLDKMYHKHVKRITLEDQGELIFEDYFLNDEFNEDVEKISSELVKAINEQHPSLSKRSKQALLIRMLELFNSGNNG